MLHYAVVFFIIALIAALLGFTGIASGAAGIAQILFVVFIVLALACFIVNLVRRRLVRGTRWCRTRPTASTANPRRAAPTR